MAEIATVHFEACKFEVTETEVGLGVLDELRDFLFILFTNPRNQVYRVAVEDDGVFTSVCGSVVRMMTSR